MAALRAAEYGSENAKQNWLLFTLPNISVTKSSRRQVLTNSYACWNFSGLRGDPKLQPWELCRAVETLPDRAWDLTNIFALSHTVVKQLFCATCKKHTMVPLAGHIVRFLSTPPVGWKVFGAASVADWEIRPPILGSGEARDHHLQSAGEWIIH